MTMIGSDLYAYAKDLEKIHKQSDPKFPFAEEIIERVHYGDFVSVVKILECNRMQSCSHLSFIKETIQICEENGHELKPKESGLKPEESRSKDWYAQTGA